MWLEGNRRRDQAMIVQTTRDLGAAIRQARKERGLSQGDLAKAVRVHQPKISAVERGAPGVRVGLVLQIIRALNLSLTLTASAALEKPHRSRRKRGAKPDLDLDKIANTGLD
jgi:HTH-type transcriptional regulator/antitoxin HipB